MMKRETIAIADIYVPVKRRATLDQKARRRNRHEHARQGPAGARSWYGQTALGSCSWKACIGWKPLKRSVKKLFSVSLSTRRGTK